MKMLPKEIFIEADQQAHVKDWHRHLCSEIIKDYERRNPPKPNVYFAPASRYRNPSYAEGPSVYVLQDLAWG